MGPIDSPAAKLCIQVTDSPYVVVNLRLTTRMGARALAKINAGTPFIRCWHSVGCPVHDRNPDTPAHTTARGAWPCDISRRKIVHFPESREVMSFGSGYGGNALLGKKCVALRIATAQVRQHRPCLWCLSSVLIACIPPRTSGVACPS